MMRLCINCDTKNADDAVFCSECGMTLTRAPTVASGMQIREQMKEAAPLFTIPMVWYATEAKANSVTKLLERDDEGSLEMTKNSITFRGSKFTVRIDTESIAGLDLTTQKPALVPLIVANAIAGLVYLLDRSAVTAIACLAVGNGTWLLIDRVYKWICIRYEEKADGSRKAYFADAGLSGILGGTRKVHERLSGWLRAYDPPSTKS